MRLVHEVKERSRLHNMKVQREAASAGGEAAASFSEGLAQIIHDYTGRQVIDVDGTAFC